MTDENHEYVITMISNGWIIKQTVGLKTITVFRSDMEQVCNYLNGDIKLSRKQ